MTNKHDREEGLIQTEEMPETYGLFVNWETEGDVLNNAREIQDSTGS